MLLASINAYLNGTPGAKHHLGYGMLARAAFGLWGSYFCVMLNVFQSFVFYVSFTRKSWKSLLMNTGDTNVFRRSSLRDHLEFSLARLLTHEEHVTRKVPTLAIS